jgi:predicted Zn finger-like uncharacterized protein
MSLATRCTACGTIFRVVQDQLKVSEGWVRCGRCQEVFNALEGLFDLEREPPPQRPVPRAPVEPEAPALVRPSAPDDWDSTQSQQRSADPVEDDPELPATNESDVLDSRFLRRELGLQGDPPEDDEEPAAAFDFADAQFPDELMHAATRPGNALEPQPAQPPRIRQNKLRTRTRKPGAKPEPVAPQFVRHAERAERWRRPAVRGVLAGLVLALMLTLVAQGAYQWRDLVAAEFPQARPYLAQVCEHTGCRLQAPRRIDDLVVESSTLVKANGGSEAYRLTVVLRNRSHLPILLPAVDLSMTDASGLLVARRALWPADFRAQQNELAAGAESTLQMLLTTGSQRVAGYTVEIFYP